VVPLFPVSLLREHDVDRPLQFVLPLEEQARSGEAHVTVSRVHGRLLLKVVWVLVIPLGCRWVLVLGIWTFFLDSVCFFFLLDKHLTLVIFFPLMAVFST
jgi:hypothetical protein